MMHPTTPFHQVKSIKALNLVGYLIIICLFMQIIACSHKQPVMVQTRIHFSAGDASLYGMLALPVKRSGPVPVVIFVHGDGPMPFDAFGYYQPIWTELAKQGIGSFSWDKRGVGGSEGNWLDQSMADRASDVLHAIKFLQSSPDLQKPSSIGLIGFSQAGWVMPQISRKQNAIDFTVLVSTAINWEQQGSYHQRMSGVKEYTDSLLTASLKKSLSYAEYQANYTQQEQQNKLPENEFLLDKDRYTFVTKNWQSDATADLQKIDVPVLAIFGEDDLNVDIANSIEHLQKALNRHAQPDQLTLKVYPQATHGLLDSRLWNTQSPGVFYVLMIDILGEDAFANGVLSDIATWIKSKAR
jgi:pimeloyl-ACP methyl ester carboxylesterase